MSKNFSDAFSHQNPECKKSAGCLSRIFQLFDNQIIRRRRLDGQGHKMGFSGHEPSSSENQRANKSELCNLKKRPSRMPQENPRFSLESPRTSTLSSSSFSSHEHKSSQEGLKNPDRSFTSGKSPKNSARAQSSDINHQSPELIDIIKESLYKDLRSVSVKEGANVLVKKNKVLKPIDSPRPMDMSKLKVLNETLRIPICSSYKGYSARFSCDGREVLQIFTDAKQSSKEREPPRLSLGSYEESLRRDLNFKVNSIFKGLEKKSKETSTASNFLEDQESNENHPSIVAKLMGLEPINLAKHNVIRSCGSSNSRRNMKTAQESKREKPSQSKGHSLIFPRSGELNLESTLNMRFPTENISAYIPKEMLLQKLQQEHSSELKKSILEIKKDCNWKQNTQNSISPQPRESKLKTKTESISESALKSARVGLPPTPVARLEIRSHVQKKQTRNSADRINGIMIVRTNEDQRPTGNKSNSRRPQHASKLPSERLENKCRSQMLELRKSDLNKKPYVVISSMESNNFKKQPKDMQSSKSVSLKLNLSNTQDNEHQNPSKQFNVDSLTLNSSKVKALLLKQSNQKSGKAINNAAAEHKKHTMKLKEDQSARHFEQDTAPQSSPNSVLDALLHYDDLPLSPVSFSSGFKEDQKLPSDHSLNVVRHPLTPPMTLSFEIDSEETDPESRYVAEILQSRRLLHEDRDLPLIVEHMNSDGSVEKCFPGKPHQKLDFDVVNEILARKMEIFESGIPQYRRPSMKHLFKEACSEINYLRSYWEASLDDKHSIYAKDFFRHFQAWGSSGSGLTEIVIVIERLIFKDMINEVVRGEIAVVSQDNSSAENHQTHIKAVLKNS